MIAGLISIACGNGSGHKGNTTPQQSQYDESFREHLDAPSYNNTPSQTITYPPIETSNSKTPDDARSEGHNNGYEQGLVDGKHGHEYGYDYDDSSDYYDYYETKYKEGYDEGYEEGYYEGRSSYKENEETE